MKRFMYFSVLIMCLAIALVIGIYIGGQLAHAGPAGESPQWDYVFYEALRGGDKTTSFKIVSTSVNTEENAKAVPVDWILYQAAHSACKGEQWMYFIVTDSEGKDILHPKAYKLYVGGYDPEMERISCFEDFPEIKWP
ncbi:hypothetical protein AMJ71_09565 [candidate division TA06 bacterium SM1_40]|uniref:Uncharacterized protein n=1 Tax=candidate division TA06 bacterium SM1_40 TaxID=1703773 RepID=A0A0S8JAD3_UNCT6|nr:MAG: hypothetical protein AMJ71_09565 [candidate division TA06 bacterium SM1_40]